MPPADRIASAKNTPSRKLAARCLRRRHGSAGCPPLPQKLGFGAASQALRMPPCRRSALEQPALGHPLPGISDLVPGKPPYAACFPLVLGRAPWSFGYALLSVL